MKDIYSKAEVRNDYDKGYSIDGIAERYRKSQEIDFGNKMSHKKAYEKVCSIIYELIMERKSIVKGGS